MYKCTECGLEFETKPEYCDCGNNEFILTIEETTEPEKNKISEEKSQADINPVNKTQELYEEHKSEKLPVTLPFHPAALGFLVLCIILSLLIIFVWNPIESNDIQKPETVEIVEQKAIPSIDKLWKANVNTGNTAKSTESPKIPAKKIATVPLKKVNTAQTQVKTQKQTAKTSTQINKTPIKTQAQDTSAAKVQEAAHKALEAKQKAEAEARAAAERARRETLAKQELANYKINLRNAIGQKIDFTRVIGDGDCIISFKVDLSGKLINRAFAEQSDNITLNNEVYKAFMALPSFTTPPALYKNETLMLNVKFTNGNFAITLK